MPTSAPFPNLNPSAKRVDALTNTSAESTMEAKTAASNALEGKTIVISGNFSISRDEMKALIEANGGKNSSSVSSKTSWLLAGSKPGPEKLKKAAELGVSVISEADLRAMLPDSASQEDPGDEEPNLFSL